MNKSELCLRLRERIKSSDLWGSRSRESGNKFSGMKCPECGRYDAWAYSDFPVTIICSHHNTCGSRVGAFELFPDLRQNIEKTFKPTADDPHRPAREYLYSRGLSWNTLSGLRFEYWENIRGTGSGGVMFYVGQEKGDRTLNQDKGKKD